MKKLILSLIAIFAMTTAVMAQDNAQQGERRKFDPAKMVEMRTKQMVETYKLNDDQAKKVKELNEKFMKNMGPRGQKPEGEKPQADKKPEGEKPQADKAQRPRGPRGGFGNNEEYNKELQTIMTEEQYKQYQEDMKKMRQHRPQGQGRPQRQQSTQE